jgi:hypothetical protein
MSEDQINKLAAAFAEVTGITFDEAKTALEDQDSTMVRMAKGVVRLHETSGAWRADMARRRRRILQAA